MADNEQTKQVTADTDRTFTQEEVNQIIAERLQRAKAGGDEVEKLQAEIAGMKADQQARLEKQLEEQNRYKELAEERAKQLAEATQKADRVDEYNELLEETANTLIEEIPEDLRTLVPDIPVAQKLSWLRTNRKKLIKPAAVSTGAGIRGASGSTHEVELTPEERMIADKFGMKYEDYAKNK